MLIKEKKRIPEACLGVNEKFAEMSESCLREEKDIITEARRRMAPLKN